VTGGNPLLAIAVGAAIGGFVGASAVDGFVAQAVNAAKDVLHIP
jgi:hypothetical protein